MHVIFLVNHPSYSFFHRPSSARAPWSQTIPTHRMAYETDQPSNRNGAVVPLSDEGYQRSPQWSYAFATRLHFRRSDLALARLRIAITTCSQSPNLQTGAFVPLRFPQKTNAPHSHLRPPELSFLRLAVLPICARPCPFCALLSHICPCGKYSHLIHIICDSATRRLSHHLLSFSPDSVRRFSTLTTEYLPRSKLT